MATVQASGESAAGRADGMELIMLRGGTQLARLMELTESRLQSVAAAVGEPLAQHSSATILAGGKRLRPLLVMLAASAGGGPRAGEAGEQALVRAAVAVELVHSASLVHDDVIDAASVRRGAPTVVASGGRQMALATGDALFARAFAELALGEQLEPLRVLSAAATALADGELMQRADAYSGDVPLERYLHRCELKTAALFEAACRLGALAGADSSAALADGLATFARAIGLAFQLLDDVLDVSGPQERTGKAPGTDLLDGTVTLPLIIARERDEWIARVDLRELDGPPDARALCERIAATGALEAARQRALEEVARAKAVLPGLLSAERSRSLELVADSVVDRYS